MKLPRLPARPGPPGRSRARPAAVLAVAIACAALIVAAGGSQRALAAGPGRPVATATAVTAAHLAPATPASPSPSPLPAPVTGTGGCGFLDFTCEVSSSITSWFAGLVKSAVNPLLTLIGQSALSTPQPGSIPAVHTMWATSLAVADACYVLLVLIGGILVMGHETLQTSYSVKEIAPRIVLGFVGANLSMVVISQAITIANGLSGALAGQGVTPATAAASLMTTLGNSISTGGIFLILLALAGVVLALVLAMVYVLRLMAVVLLAAAAPARARVVCAAADRVGGPLVVAGADRRAGHPGRPGPGPDRRRPRVLRPRLAALAPDRLPGTGPDHAVPAVGADADPVLDRPPGPVPVRPLPAAPRRPVRRHRRRAVPGRAAAARHRVRQRQGRRVRERKERKKPVSYEVPDPVPIPADVEMPDKILAGLTARQVAIAAVGAVIIWAGWVAARHVLPLPAFAVLAAPAGLAATALVIGERDGLPLDRLLAAAWRQARSPRRLVTAPEGIAAPPAWAVPDGPPHPPLPAPLAPLWRHISPDGVIGLGGDGAAAVAAVSTVNFALRSPAEQDALTAAYGRWLNSLTGPAQILIRAGRADLSAAVTALREAAGGLPHPALESRRTRARRVPGWPGRRPGRAHPPGAAGHPRARPRHHPAGRRDRRGAGRAAGR